MRENKVSSWPTTPWLYLNISLVSIKTPVSSPTPNQSPVFFTTVYSSRYMNSKTIRIQCPVNRLHISIATCSLNHSSYIQVEYHKYVTTLPIKVHILNVIHVNMFYWRIALYILIYYAFIFIFINH